MASSLREGTTERGFQVCYYYDLLEGRTRPLNFSGGLVYRGEWNEKIRGLVTARGIREENAPDQGVVSPRASGKPSSFSCG